jgi:hypothetical protein
MGAARAAKLVVWLASTALFALVAGAVCAMGAFLITWHDCSNDQPSVLILWIPVGVFEVASLALAIREWRRTAGAIPSYLWWLVLGFGPGAIAVVLAFAVFGRS